MSLKGTFKYHCVLTSDVMLAMAKIRSMPIELSVYPSVVAKRLTCNDKNAWIGTDRVVRIGFVFQDGCTAGQTLREENGLLLRITAHTHNSTASPGLDISQKVKEGWVDVRPGRTC